MTGITNQKNREMTQLQKLNSIRLCLSAHPDNEPNSEFADRISDLDELIKNTTTANGMREWTDERVGQAMREYADQQNAELRERVKELEAAVVSELESILEQIQGVHSDYVEDVIKERISILKHGL